MGQARYSHRVSLKTTTAVVVIAEDEAELTLRETAGGVVNHPVVLFT
jgi:hypothetical protein